jgi:conjugal transfer pilus assembly protein TraW
MAGTSTIGRTWPIAETDALTEIEGKAASTPADPARFGPRSGWSGLKAASLSAATVSRTRFVVPFYTLDDDIRLPDGRLLYAKGYTFNPLAYTSLPQRLIVVRPKDLNWAMGRRSPGMIFS